MSSAEQGARLKVPKKQVGVQNQFYLVTCARTFADKGELLTLNDSEKVVARFRLRRIA